MTGIVLRRLSIFKFIYMEEVNELMGKVRDLYINKEFKACEPLLVKCLQLLLGSSSDKSFSVKFN